jgi:DNA-binding NarL/FixJ family response regulator
MTVRVLVVDDQELVRDGIAALLGIQDGLGLRDRTQAAIRARELGL